MAFYVYILRCNDGSYYTGHTDDIETRIASHVSGEYGGYTSTRRPVTLVFLGEFPTRYEALERERQIKGSSRAKKEALMRGDWERVQQLARSRSRQQPGALDEPWRSAVSIPHPNPAEGELSVAVDPVRRPSTSSGRTGILGSGSGSGSGRDHAPGLDSPLPWMSF